MAREYLTVTRLSTKDLIRFFSKVTLHPDASWQGSLCWIWSGYRIWDGYGRIRWGSRGERTHRLIFAWLVHPIPKGRKYGEIDHLCKRVACCNPIHLEFVSAKTNQLRSNGIGGTNSRKTHCMNGHEFTPENLIADTYGRRCKTCVRERMRGYRKANPELGKIAHRKHVEKIGREELRRRERERYNTNKEYFHIKAKAKRERRKARKILSV